ncbi:glycoside hydrolase family 3 protein [Parablautia intestinalis]|uniref:glycoside hydrolase family 3 protein n=1 Tax=Parablautia intestinalis TaxID=2320100 RepID=UPI00256F3112|nr:glycoside hydrolase family 3 N-terminal domain-containing protein [Parablautia intestinalis]
MATPRFIKNPSGPVLGVTDIPVLKVDGLYFKDMERTGSLLPYEDWRLPAKERARDLASRLSVEEIAGLMMYSAHQMVPSLQGSPFAAAYRGKSFEESGAEPWEMTDAQKKFLSEDHVRYVLAMYIQNGEIAARWNNEMQAFCEALPHALPVNISSDPRHGASKAAAEFKSEAADTSKWPDGMAMAATFDPDLCREFGRVVAQEYRALGIATALGPQIDVGTEPRWMRVEDTYGVCPELVTDMARAYCDGLQTDPGASSDAEGWGSDSVSAMVKHWPGGGPCEGGRDAHYPFGKFAVYPGRSLDQHLKPFLEGAFKLDGPTGKAAAVMPYYTVSWRVDPSGQNVGNSYSKYIINDLLREKYGYDGVVCTDWGITQDPDDKIDSFGSRCYGCENMTEAERHLRILENGVDQFGGNNDIKPILEAYRLGCKKYGEKAMRERFERSAARLLLNSFRCGLFENPYLDPKESVRILGCKEFCEAGFAAQLKSVVMVKNNGVLPVSGRKKVFIPGRTIDERKNFFRGLNGKQSQAGADRKKVEEFFEWADSPKEADFAVCFIESPLSDGYSEETGYRPIMLQYRPYTAMEARKESIAGGDFREDFSNRSYFGKSNRAANEKDLDLILDTRRAMPDKPVIVVVRMHNPCVLAEFEPYADAILVDFGVEEKAVLTLISGRAQPEGLLPVQLPADMETVERHAEDIPLDYCPYKDSHGNVYDFGFGMNWNGVIHDERNAKYHR